MALTPHRIQWNGQLATVFSLAWRPPYCLHSQNVRCPLGVTPVTSCHMSLQDLGRLRLSSASAVQRSSFLSNCAGQNPPQWRQFKVVIGPFGRISPWRVWQVSRSASLPKTLERTKTDQFNCTKTNVWDDAGAYPCDPSCSVLESLLLTLESAKMNRNRTDTFLFVIFGTAVG